MLEGDDRTCIADVVPLMTNNMHTARVDSLHRLLGHRVTENDDRLDFGPCIGVEVLGSVVYGITALRISAQYDLRVGALGDGVGDDFGPNEVVLVHICSRSHYPWLSIQGCHLK